MKFSFFKPLPIILIIAALFVSQAQALETDSLANRGAMTEEVYINGQPHSSTTISVYTSRADAGKRKSYAVVESITYPDISGIDPSTNYEPLISTSQLQIKNREANHIARLLSFVNWKQGIVAKDEICDAPSLTIRFLGNKQSLVSTCGPSDLPSASSELRNAMSELRRVMENTLANGEIQNSAD